MNETYLQQIWAQKRLPSPNLITTSGHPLLILDFGEHNTDCSGPDFLFGCIEMSGIKLYGNIEIHVKASDWYKHGHQHDVNYHNVILHVVFENDQDIEQNERVIPTLELKGLVDPEHYWQFQRSQRNHSTFPCAYALNEVPGIYLESIKAKAFQMKLNAKIKPLLEQNCSQEEAFYQVLALAFGTSINKIGFAELTERVPIREMRKLKPHQKYALLLTESGILLSSSGQQAPTRWHFKGTRPKNFPSVRVRQFAYLIAYCDITQLVLNTPVSELVPVFRRYLEEIWGTRNEAPPLSRSFKDHLVINAIIPYLWYIGEKMEDDRMHALAEDVLRSISPERNRITEKWKSIDIPVNCAYDSQSLLALFRYYCNPKKCLSCEAGNKVLNRTE